MSQVVAFGELLWDLLPTGEVLGGAPANFIFRVNSFGDQGILISRLGNDLLGEKARLLVAEIGLSVEHIQTDFEFPSGTVEVKLDEKGVPDFTIIKEVAYDHIELSSEMVQQVREADCLYFGTLIQRYGISKNTLRELIKETAEGAVKFLDINLRKDCYTYETINESLHSADILKINDEELLTLKKLLGLHCSEIRNMAGELVSRYQLDLILVTLGEKGALLMSCKNDIIYSPGYKVQLVDTVGAGDAFSAGFVHAYLNGDSLKAALDFGNAAGAFVAATRGATQMIRKEDIISFIGEDQKRVSW